MRRPLQLALSIAAASWSIVAAVPSASAVESFGASVRVSPDGCVRVSAAAGPDGVVRGAVQCGWQLRPVSGNASAWRLGPALAPQGQLLDAAQDATGTYVLFRGVRGGVGVVKVARDGKPGPTRWLTTSTAVDSFGSIVARGGRWAAVWTEFRDSTPSTDLWQAGTLFAEPGRRQVTTDARRDTGPSLALRPGGGLVLLWARLDSGTTQLRLANSSGGAWSSRQLAASPSITYPSLVAGDRSLFATWSRGTRAVVASNESGTWVSRSPAAWPCARDNTHLTAVAGKLVVGYNTCDNNRLVVHERASARWTGVTLFPSAALELNTLSATGSNAVVLGARLGSDPQRFHILARSQA